MGKRLVCLCNLVEENEILLALKKGATTTKEIQVTTRAGTSCGRCITEIDRMVEDYQKKKPKDPQTKLDFGF